MRRIIALGAALALSGCGAGGGANNSAGAGRGGEQTGVEAAVRAHLGTMGDVQQLDLTRRGEGSYGGFAMVRNAAGRTVRVDCTARRTQGTNFQIECGQLLDEALLDEIEQMFRQNLAAQGVTVTAIELTRQDDDHATGYADVRQADGAEGRLTCNAARDAATRRFHGTCTVPEGEGAEDAPPAEAEEGVEGN